MIIFRHPTCFQTAHSSVYSLSTVFIFEQILLYFHLHVYSKHDIIPCSRVAPVMPVCPDPPSLCHNSDQYAVQQSPAPIPTPFVFFVCCEFLWVCSTFQWVADITKCNKDYVTKALCVQHLGHIYVNNIIFTQLIIMFKYSTTPYYLNLWNVWDKGIYFG